MRSEEISVLLLEAEEVEEEEEQQQENKCLTIVFVYDLLNDVRKR
jgi:hypothetical protein